MRIATVLAVALALAGCTPPGERFADQARRICIGNGHAPGTPAFDQCFAGTFSALNVAQIGR